MFLTSVWLMNAQEKEFRPPFRERPASVYTNIRLSGGYSMDSQHDFPYAKLKLEAAEGIFSNVSISSAVAVTAGYSSSASMNAITLAVPNIDIGYYFGRLKIFGGASLFQAWYFANEESAGVEFQTMVHSYGYLLEAGASFSINDYVGFFTEYSFAPHPWIVTPGNRHDEWLYPHRMDAGVEISIPWKL